MELVYGSVFSGIEGASVAFEPLGWKPAFFAEIDPFACAVLAQRYGSNLPGKGLPGNGVPNYGDITTIDPARCAHIDLLIGGSPCQAFSVAGLRGSLADVRGNLTLAYVRLAHAINDLRLDRGDPGLILVWENVPGVLSTKDNAFGTFLAGLVGADAALDSPYERGRWPDTGLVAGPLGAAAWRVVDAQYFGLAQRRRRVFLIAGLAGRIDPAKVLFERKSLQRHPPPRRKAGEGTAPGIAPSLAGSGRGVERCGELRGRDPVEAVGDVAATLEATAGRSRGAGTPVGMLAVHPFCRDHSVCHNPNACDGNDCWLLRSMQTGTGIPSVAGTLDAAGDKGGTYQDARGGRLLPVQAAYANAGHFGTMRAVDVCDPLRAKGGDVGNGGESLIAAYGGNNTSGEIEVATALKANEHGSGYRYDFESETLVTQCVTGDVTHALKADGFDGSEDGTGRGQPIVPHVEEPLFVQAVADPIATNEAKTWSHEGSNNFRTRNLTAFTAKDSGGDASDDIAPPLRAMGHDASHANGGGQLAVAFDTTQITHPENRSNPQPGDPCHPLAAQGHPPALASTAAVRRLTPLECERLQGFPDDYTQIPWRGKPADQCPDGPRYKGLGNSFAVPCVRWLGERINAVLDGEA